MKKKIELTDQEIKYQKITARKHLKYVRKELEFGHLIDWDRFDAHKKAYNKHSELAQRGHIEMDIK